MKKSIENVSPRSRWDQMDFMGLEFLMGVLVCFVWQLGVWMVPACSGC